MMRSTFATLLTALLLLPVADRAVAQEDEWVRTPYRFTIALDGGIGTPIGPGNFNDLWNASFPASATLGYLVIPQISVKGWVTYARWGISEIPANNALGVDEMIGGASGSRVTEISGGTISTTLFGGSAEYFPFPNNRILPSVEIGVGYFLASGEDLSVVHIANGDTLVANTMADADGPAFLGAVTMGYDINERWNVNASFRYYLGISDTFAPGELTRRPNGPPAETGNLEFVTIVLGIILKM
jgi:hypothetical protein